MIFVYKGRRRYRTESRDGQLQPGDRHYRRRDTVSPFSLSAWLTRKLTLGCRVTDAEAVAMSRFLVEQDGLFVGSSSAVNLVACVRVARQLGKGKTIVCILWSVPSSVFYMHLH